MTRCLDLEFPHIDRLFIYFSILKLVSLTKKCCLSSDTYCAAIKTHNNSLIRKVISEVEAFSTFFFYFETPKLQQVSQSAMLFIRWPYQGNFYAPINILLAYNFSEKRM